MGEVIEIQGKTVLVTGASGLIGSAVVEELLVRGARVVAAGRSEKRLRGRFGRRGGLSFLLYDATQHNEFKLSVDYAIIAASPASPDLFVAKPVDVILANTLAVNELLMYAVKTRISKVVYVSSSEVYGKMTPPETGFTEKHFGEIDISNPRNSYAEAKRAAELLCVSYAKQCDLNVSIVRPGHVYGPAATENDRRVSSSWLWHAARGKDIVMKSDGAQLRSYIHCRDCATAILKVLERGESAEAYNISNRNSVVTIRFLAEEICNVAGVRLRMEAPNEQESVAFNPMLNSSLDASKLESLGWTATYDIRSGLQQTISEMKKTCRG